MTYAVQTLQDVVCVAFVALSALTVFRWLRDRNASTGLLALAIASLGLVTLIGRITAHTGVRNGFLTDVNVIAFCVSGYALLEFRGTILRLSRRTRWLAASTLAIAAVLYIVSVPEPGDSARTSVQSVAVMVLILAWTACVVEPIARFWLAARDLPAVQAARLRSLAVGYSMLVAILVASGVGGSATRGAGFTIATQLMALLIVPALYAAFAPPTWLRRIWREPEEEALRQAVEELLLFSPTRAAMAEKAVDWAIRLVGGDAGFVADSDGSILASKGISDGAAGNIGATIQPGDRQLRTVPSAHNATALIAPLRLDAGDGRMVVLSGPYTPFFGADEVRRLQGYATAVTAGLDRTVLTEKITALERTKTEFLNLASHELRGPITILRGYLSMLEAGTLGEMSESARQVLPLLSAKATEANSLVEQMIEAARLEEGRLELKPERVDLRHLAETAVDMVRPIVDEGHRLRVVGPAGVPVNADPERIQTIVGNLLSNAVKYSPNGGEVTCEVIRADGVGKILVSDHGLGIAPEDMATLFTRFGRISTRDTAHIGGTGLGLYLSRELARLHGGDLTAESHPGAGSTFTLALPLAPTPSMQKGAFGGLMHATTGPERGTSPPNAPLA